MEAGSCFPSPDHYGLIAAKTVVLPTWMVAAEIVGPSYISDNLWSGLLSFVYLVSHSLALQDVVS